MVVVVVVMVEVVDGGGGDLNPATDSSARWRSDCLYSWPTDSKDKRRSEGERRPPAA